MNRKIDWSLYGILDKEAARARSLTLLAEQLIAGGAGVLQLRNKISPADEFYRDALAVVKVTRAHGIPLIINDRVDVALAAGADGVHLGQEDLPFAAARKLIGSGRMLGVSVHDIREFEAALAGKPDYLGVGTIYPTRTKKGLKTKGTDFLCELRSRTPLPLVAIGGITLDNLAAVFQAGADGIAVISDLLAHEDVLQRAKMFRQRIEAARKNVPFENK